MWKPNGADEGVILLKACLVGVTVLLIFLLSGNTLFSQTGPPDSLRIRVDTLLMRTDTTLADSTLAGSRSDTIRNDTTRTGDDMLDAPVDYQAKDSIIFDVEGQMVFLYGGAEVYYKDITLKSDYIEMDLEKREVFARGLPDSTGQIAGKPVFSEGQETFESSTLTYNFDSKKGLITGIISQQEGGYLHSERTKREADGTINIARGKYTTCDAEDPHFYLALTKAKVIPEDKIVSGPAYMVLEDIPLPLILPFGFFPNQQTRASGILIPEWGEERNRGFFLRNGGYYFALGQYFDLAVTGDVYSNGTWGLRATSNYRVRYRFNGNLSLRYYKNVSGDLDLGTYSANQDYNIIWSHRQDAKANPTSTFSAQVNMSSSSYDRNHSYQTPGDYLTSTKQSSISYSKRWEGTPFNFTGSFTHSQNSANKSVNLNFPKMNLNMNRIYPFRGLSKTGASKWYSNIELSYSSRFENRINTYDSLLFTPEVFDEMDMGFQHQIPLSANFKLFRNFNISPRIQYTGNIYTRSKRLRWDPDYIDPETGINKPMVIQDTVYGFQYAHSYLPSISMSFNPKIYGLFQFKNPESKVVAIRHVMSPTLGFSFVPDMTGLVPNYYDTVQVDTLGNTRVYSYYENGIYGTPSLNGRSGSINFSLNNNIEMKLRSASDTTEEMRKIKLLDNLRFSTSYNIYADSLKLAPISFSGYTSILEGRFRLNFSGSLDPYALNPDGRRINTFELKQSGKPVRLTRFNAGLDFRLSSKQKPGSAIDETSRQRGISDMPMSMSQMGEEEEEEVDIIQAMEESYSEYVDFSIPWDLSIRYNFNYSKPQFESNITQTLNFSGNVRLTNKWRIGVTSGWDFERNTLTYTSVNIFRDLHCWEMRLSWIPIGYHQSYTFSINAKASILRDLKYERRKSWYDN
jgi:hypothetical protein